MKRTLNLCEQIGVFYIDMIQTTAALYLTYLPHAPFSVIKIWSAVLNAALRSSRRSTDKSPLSEDIRRAFVIFTKSVSVCDELITPV